MGLRGLFQIETRQIQFFSGIVLLSALLMSFQNCGNVEFAQAPLENASLDEDANTDTQCVVGKRLGIWLDPDDSGRLIESNFLGSIVTYSGPHTAKENYNYFSASAHPLVGPIPGGFEAHVFFYEGPDGLALNFYANVDNGGSTSNQFGLDIEVTGNQSQDDMILSDDGPEFKLISRTADATSYEGRFRYGSNTDGGVLGPFIGEDFRIHVKMLATGDIQDARFYSAGGSSFRLQSRDKTVSSFILAFKTYQTCGPVSM